MQRSSREGPLADIPSARVRFAAEAGFLILVAVGAALAELRPLAIIILMACAWLLVALIERASSRESGRADEVEPVPDFAPQPAPDPLPATETREAYRWLFWRRSRARLEELPSPTASLEERPARSHVRRLEPEPEPVEAPAAVAEPDLEPAEPARPSPRALSICPASRSRLRLKSPPPHRRAHGFSSGPPAPPHRPSRRLPRHHHPPGSGTSGISSGVRASRPATLRVTRSGRRSSPTSVLTRTPTASCRRSSTTSCGSRSGS